MPNDENYEELIEEIGSVMHVAQIESIKDEINKKNIKLKIANNKINALTEELTNIKSKDPYNNLRNLKLPCSLDDLFISTFNSNVMDKPIRTTVKGVYFKNPESKVFNNYYPDYLKSYDTESYISLKLLEKTRNDLIDKHKYNFTGYFNRSYSHKGTINTNFTVSEIDAYNYIGPLLTNEQELEVKRIKNHKKIPYQEVIDSIKDSLRNNKTVIIALIMGNQNIIKKDLKYLYNSSNYKIYEFLANMTSTDDIIEKIKSAESSNPDIIALVRGGGSFMEFEIFNNIELSKTILNLNSNLIFITAIGHAVNQISLIQQVSHLDYMTPGTFSSKLLGFTSSIDSKNKDLLINNLETKLNDTKIISQTQSGQYYDLKKELDANKKEFSSKVNQYRLKIIKLYITMILSIIIIVVIAVDTIVK